MVNKSNQNLLFKGQPLKTEGQAVHEGQKAPDFKLVNNDLQDVTLSQFSGKTLVLSVVPSVDTPTCALQTKQFKEEAKKLGDKVCILTVSMDLPFAQKRWCENEDCATVQTASDYKYRTFGNSYGVFLPDTGLLGRAVFVIDPQQTIKHVQYVTELSTEPDYSAVLEAL